jgi:hypothetical protein
VQVKVTGLREPVDGFAFYAAWQCLTAAFRGEARQGMGIALGHRFGPVDPFAGPSFDANGLDPKDQGTLRSPGDHVGVTSPAIALFLFGAAFELVGIVLVGSPDLFPAGARFSAWLRQRVNRLLLLSGAHVAKRSPPDRRSQWASH